MLNEDDLEMIGECTFAMPDGAYFDDEGMLHAKDGEELPDGLYRTDSGELVSYEGNFLRMMGR